MTRDHLDTDQAADYLGMSASWLAASRCNGTGPPFYKLGNRVRYIKASLDAWAASRQVNSTAQDRLSQAGQ
jgi:predicted DNA-binding transcriptional regulator AlpA